MLVSCTLSKEKSTIEIYGYKLGDTLTNEFKVTKVQDFPFSRAVLIKDERVEISLINNNITSITFEELTQKEHDSIKKMVSEKMKSEPKYYKGETPYNVKIEGEIFYWKDTIIGTEVSLGRNPKKDTVFSYLSVHNHILSDSLLDVYVPDLDTTIIIIEDFED